jgi:hypothetical protein
MFRFRRFVRYQVRYSLPPQAPLRKLNRNLQFKGILHVGLPLRSFLAALAHHGLESWRAGRPGPDRFGRFLSVSAGRLPGVFVAYHQYSYTRGVRPSWARERSSRPTLHPLIAPLRAALGQREGEETIAHNFVTTLCVCGKVCGRRRDESDMEDVSHWLSAYSMLHVL